MADKPKTYAQQVQGLKEELASVHAELAAAKEQIEFVAGLQNEIADLKAELERRDKADMQRISLTKAQTTDLEQRALSAEQGLKNLQASIQALNLENSALQQQLDIAGAERDKANGKQQKIDLLAEELQASNLRVANLNQQLKDFRAMFDENDAALRKETQKAKTERDGFDAALQEVSQRLADKIVEIESLKDNFNGKLTAIYHENHDLKNQIQHFRSLLNKAPDTLDQLRQAIAGS